jgi:hypothetical protein
MKTEIKRTIRKGLRRAKRFLVRRLFTEQRKELTVEESVTLRHGELDQLIFGQHHLGTQDFFTATYGQAHTVPLTDFPHYLFLRDHLQQPRGDSAYRRYLDASWTYRFGTYSAGQVNAQIDRFLRLYGDLSDAKRTDASAFREPVLVCRRPDDRMILIDGNHRAAIALFLGLDLPAAVVSAREYLSRTAKVPDVSYGADRRELPYQSLFHAGEELVLGRRRDIQERTDLLNPADLRGRSVLDLGCNIGSSSFCAAEAGAREVTGVDLSPKLVSTAIRLNAYFARPCTFRAHDLNREFAVGSRFDTVFCFSVTKHVEDQSGLRATILNSTGRVLYFEGHPKTRLGDYENLLNDRYFTSIQLVAMLKEGIHSDAATRPLFRCEVRV